MACLRRREIIVRSKKFVTPTSIELKLKLCCDNNIAFVGLLWLSLVWLSLIWLCLVLFGLIWLGLVYLKVN